MFDAKELLELLEFAYNNMGYLDSDDQDEFDWCLICGEPEWRHTKDCNGIKWTNRVKEILFSQGG